MTLTEAVLLMRDCAARHKVPVSDLKKSWPGRQNGTIPPALLARRMFAAMAKKRGSSYTEIALILGCHAYTAWQLDMAHRGTKLGTRVPKEPT